MTEISKSQIDRLGDRLKKGSISDDDLRLLDKYRRSFSVAYDTVVGIIRNELALEPTGRPAKSTTSISDKLRRESIRLTQIQDIAGCRLIVDNISNQEEVVNSLKTIFENVSVIDRRSQPSHGYRAVHVVVVSNGKSIEIQIRTSLQHLWAELSEKFSDIVNPAIKYGGGDADTQAFLLKASHLVSQHELLEVDFAEKLIQSSSIDGFVEHNNLGIKKIQENIEMLKQRIFEIIRGLIADLGTKGRK